MKYRQIDSETVEVYDSKNRVFLISPCDINLVEKYTWYVSKVGYVERKEWCKGANITRRIHKYILPNEKLVDHINGDRRDNRRGNLRGATKSTNAMNSPLPSDNKTGYKGIIRRTDYPYKTPRWRAIITVDGKRIGLGTFRSIEEAGKARKLAEEKYFGEYARCY